MAKKKQSSNQLEVQNAAKTLFANIRFMSPDNPVRSIVMTSSVPNEGKSTCSLELARAIATSGMTVLLVEADMRRRTLAGMMNVRPAGGIYSVLTDGIQLKDAVTDTKTPNLFFLDVEPNIPNPADILSSKRYRKLVSVLKESYDYIIFDTPPVGTFVDAAILSTLVDGTILVVKAGTTKRTDLENACEQLKKADAHILGICASFCESSSSEYYYVYYAKNGERVKDDKAAVAVSPETRAPISTHRANRGAQGSSIPAGGRGGLSRPNAAAGRGHTK